MVLISLQRFYIFLNIKNWQEKMFCFFIRYKNLVKIPKKIFDMIQFYEPWSSDFGDDH